QRVNSASHTRPSYHHHHHRITLRPPTIQYHQPNDQHAPPNPAIHGPSVLKPSIFRILETTHEGVGGEIQLTDALRAMAQQEKMLGLEFEGTYHDVGTVSGFLKTSIAFALERPGLRDELMRYLETLDGLKPPS